MNPDFGQNAGLLAGVERVVDRLLDGRQQGLAGVVETEQVAILRRKLADRDITLAGGHRLGRRAAALGWAGLPIGICGFFPTDDGAVGRLTDLGRWSRFLLFPTIRGFQGRIPRRLKI